MESELERSKRQTRERQELRRLINDHVEAATPVERALFLVVGEEQDARHALEDKVASLARILVPDGRQQAEHNTAGLLYRTQKAWTMADTIKAAVIVSVALSLAGAVVSLDRCAPRDAIKATRPEIEGPP